MLRTTGQKRTFTHNLHLAILLSTAAGFINAAGLIAFSVLTTNVTGHAATFAQDLAIGDFAGLRLALMWLLLFFSGALFSAWYVGFQGRNARFAYSFPLFIEFLVLLYVAVNGFLYDGSVIKQEQFAGSLLFVMGVQNGLVTVISRSIVRTTHLTGIVTDLGIAVASLIHAKFKMSKGLKQRLVLRSLIILFFIAGGVVGAYTFIKYRYDAFYIPAVLVLITLLFDAFRRRVRMIMHNFNLRSLKRVR